MVSEFLATFIFVFVTCSAGVNAGKIFRNFLGWNVQGLIIFLVSVALIYALSPLSGAHFNPAISAGLAIAGQMDPLLAVFYIINQVLGAVLATGFIGLLYQESQDNLELVFHKKSNWILSTLMETILSFLLVFVVLSVAFGYGDSEECKNSCCNQILMSSNDEEAELETLNSNKQCPKSCDCATKAYYIAGVVRKILAPLAIAATLGFLAYLGQSVSGGAYNPARATGPAILAFDFKDLEIYWFGGLFGAFLAAMLYRGILEARRISSTRV